MNLNDGRNMDEYEDDDSANSGKSIASLASVFSGFQAKGKSSNSVKNLDDDLKSKE